MLTPNAFKDIRPRRRPGASTLVKLIKEHIFYCGHSKSRNIDTSCWSPENDELNLPVMESSPAAKSRHSLLQLYLFRRAAPSLRAKSHLLVTFQTTRQVLDRHERSFLKVRPEQCLRLTGVPETQSWVCSTSNVRLSILTPTNTD
jgi:hypothetical protein